MYVDSTGIRFVLTTVIWRDRVNGLPHLEAILAVRTWAFMAKSNVVAIFLITGLVGETAYLLYVSIAGVHQTELVFDGPCTASDAPGKVCDYSLLAQFGNRLTFHPM